MHTTKSVKCLNVYVRWISKQTGAALVFFLALPVVWRSELGSLTVKRIGVTVGFSGFVLWLVCWDGLVVVRGWVTSRLVLVCGVVGFCEGTLPSLPQSLGLHRAVPLRVAGRQQAKQPPRRLQAESSTDDSPFQIVT